jgi:uncharacterized protein YcgI (DUF1989 family)
MVKPLYGTGNLFRIVGNVNFFMSVPVLPDGSASIANRISQPGSYVELRAECDVLAVLSNCPQMHNPCNGFNPTPIQVAIYKPLAVRCRHRRASSRQPSALRAAR